MSRILPILFNIDMVRAILDGRKTVTRQVAKGVYPFSEYGDFTTMIQGEMTGPISMENVINLKCKYQPGDILYVRETVWQLYGTKSDRATGETVSVDYFNNFRYCATDEKPDDRYWRKRPSIHMPKEAARIWLKVTDVRVERLRDITEEQAKAEGANYRNGKNVGWEEKMRRTAEERFAEIWDSTLKKSDLDRYGWEANPWVWVIEFERCENPEREG